MSWSQAEVRALAAKAACGAGAPPAQASLFGHAVTLHLGQGRGVTDVAHALEALPQGPIMALPLCLRRLVGQMFETTSCTGTVICHGLPDLAQSYIETLPFQTSIKATSAQALSVILNGQVSARPLPVVRISGCGPLVTRMTELAARTLVPESDASRRAGAGSGQTDND